MAIDDNTLYGLTGAQVKELPERIEAVKGLAKVLTADDYNYDDDSTGTNNAVALWLLNPGLYTRGDNVRVRTTTTQYATGRLFLVGEKRNNVVSIYNMGSSSSESAQQISLLGVDMSGTQQWHREVLSYDNVVNNLTSTFTTTPLSAAQGKVLKDLIDSIAIRGAGAPTTSTAGEVGQLYEDGTNGELYQLKSIDITTTPNTYNWEQVGAGGGGGIHTLTADDYNYPVASPSVIATWLLDPGVYYIEDNLHSKVYVTGSLNVSDNVDVIVVTKSYLGVAGIYIFGIGAGFKRYNTTISTGEGTSTTDFTPPTVTQSTGTSTTDVMSQNAVTSMVYADPSSLVNGGVRIGGSASLSNSARGVALGAWASVTNGQWGVAIGASSKSSAPSSVALGSGAQATVKGQMDISTSLTGYETNGYNNSQYRLLTGLYDPQSAHDAATKGYVDTAVSGISVPETFTTNEWDALWA